MIINVSFPGLRVSQSSVLLFFFYSFLTYIFTLKSKVRKKNLKLGNGLIFKHFLKQNVFTNFKMYILNFSKGEQNYCDKVKRDLRKTENYYDY